MNKAAGSTRFTPAAERLLMERLGFAPRLLAQEVRKLAAASAGGEVDENLVRRSVFPRSDRWKWCGTQSSNGGRRRYSTS